MNVIANRVGKFVAYTAAGLFGLLVLFYLLLLFINRNDQPPSDLAVAYAERSQLRADSYSPTGNGSTLLLGFGAPPDVDPWELGRARLTWIETTESFNSTDGDPGWPPYELKISRTDEIQEFAEACRKRDETNCNFVSQREIAARWIDSESWLIDRYRRLIELPFSEPQAKMAALLFPPLLRVYEGQRLFIIQSWLNAIADDDYDTALATANRELAFWRTTLATAETLDTKWLATGAINAHFRLTQQALRELEVRGIVVDAPSGWTVPLSNEERSLQRVLERDWRDWVHFLSDDAVALSNGSQNLPDRALAVVFAPLLRPQDLKNRYAEWMEKYSKAFAVALPQLPQSLDEIQAEKANASFRPGLYNPIGDVLLEMVRARDYVNHAARIADLEGVRRIALLAARGRVEGVEPIDIPRYLRNADLKNPYTNETFELDAEEGTIIFRGLERASGRRYETFY